MKTYQFFKANLNGQGYSLTWADDPPDRRPSTRLIERALPDPDVNASPQPVAYGASLIGSTQVLLVIGVYWPQHKDEFGRAGLSFWHGILCDTERPIASADVGTFSNLLLGLVKRYTAGYARLGELIAEMAKTLTQRAWQTQFVRLAEGLPEQIDTPSKKMLINFQQQIPRLPLPANLRPAPTAQPYTTLPFLLRVLLDREDVNTVAGGSLARVDPAQIPMISVNGRVTTHTSVQLAINGGAPALQEEKVAALPRKELQRGRAKQPNRQRFPYLAGAVVLALFLIVIWIVIRPVNVNVSGQVLDARTGLPIASKILLNGEVITPSPDGFSIELEPGIYQIEVSSPGYQRWMTTLDSQEISGDLDLKILLSRDE